MRPIKFRAFDINYKKMLTPKQLEDSGVHLHASGCLFITDINDKEILCERLEAMQFTGLHDKNGREIYEGDIIQGDNQLFTVAWDDRYSKFYLRHDGKYYSWPSWDYGVLKEVIGNIHENGDLLNG